MVRVETTRFGEMEVSEEEIIEMVEPILGFPWAKRFVIKEHRPGIPFKWFQCIDDGSLAFVIVDPRVFKEDYKAEISFEEAERLGITGPGDAVVYVLVTIPHDSPRDITINLRAPIVINLKTRKAKQVILDDDMYPIKYKVFDK